MKNMFALKIQNNPSDILKEYVSGAASEKSKTTFH